MARTAGTSAYPPEVTAQMVANFVTGGAAATVLARAQGVTVRVVDVSVDVDWPASGLPVTGDVTAHRIRRGSGSIDREDAMTHEECVAALLLGARVADELIDAGADLLIAGDMGIGNTTPAAALVGLLADVEPARVVGRGTGIDDATWMRKTAAVRDAMRRGRPVKGDPVALLATCGGPDLAATTGFLLQAASRRTPVLLDGIISSACALVAHRVAFRASQWWLASHRSTEPAAEAALKRLGLEPLLDLRMRLGEGSGALVALPLVIASGELLRGMATFDSAGVSDRPAEAAAEAVAETPEPAAATPEPAAAQPTTREAGAGRVDMSADDPLRFAVGTFTRVPVPPPSEVTPDISGRGLALGPAIGAAIGLASGALLLVTGVDLMARLLSATLVVALAAWITRGLHWDGLADVADGLGSGAEPDRAREIMRRSDIGPFGVLALVFTIALQALSIAQLPAGAPALAAWVLAVTLGRLAVAVGCGTWARPARADGLGAMVIGSVTPSRLVIAGTLSAVVAVATAMSGPIPWSAALFWGPLAAIAVALGLGGLARRRFGGSTGDVLGATAELGTLAVLLVLALH